MAIVTSSPSPAEPPGVAPGLQAAVPGQPLPGPAGGDPLDDAVYHYPPALLADPSSPDLYPHARWAGRLPPLRLPPPPAPWGQRPSRPALVVLSVVDLWAFSATLRGGPHWLAPVALVGLVATLWHLHAMARRLSPARWSRWRPVTTAVLHPLTRAWPHVPTSPDSPAAPQRRRGARPGPARWLPRTSVTAPGLEPAALFTALAVLAGLLVHLTVTATP